MNRRDRGISVYATIFGKAEQDTPAALAAAVGPAFAEEAFHAAGGAAWSHPSLTPRDRSIAVITALACQGVGGERLRSHVRLGMAAGLDPEALMALMTLLASYVGFPRASIAVETIRDGCAADPSHSPGESE